MHGMAAALRPVAENKQQQQNTHLLRLLPFLLLVAARNSQCALSPHTRIQLLLQLSDLLGVSLRGSCSRGTGSRSRRSARPSTGLGRCTWRGSPRGTRRGDALDPAPIERQARAHGDTDTHAIHTHAHTRKQKYTHTETHRNAHTPTHTVNCLGVVVIGAIFVVLGPGDNKLVLGRRRRRLLTEKPKRRPGGQGTSFGFVRHEQVS